MHILDLIMYFIILAIIYKMCGGEEMEMGALIFIPVSIAYSVVYTGLFYFGEYNWIDIFNNLYLNIQL